MSETAKSGTEIISVTPVIGASGGLEGAERTTRETARWNPSMRSPDATINRAKPMADARGRDITANDGYAQGALTTNQEGIVGAEFRLNAAPNWRVLGLSEEWADEWQEIVEARWTAIATSDNNWLDASRRGSFTDLIRLAVASFVLTGEVLASSEWITNERLRPLRTAFRLISPDRLSNPNGVSDSETMRRGVELDRNGSPIYYHIRSQHPGEMFFTSNSYRWQKAPARTSWGRWQIHHAAEQRLPDQSRGISDMVAVLKSMKMTKQFSEIVLQNAVVNATYAAAIESEMPSDAVVAAMGGSAEGVDSALGWYLSALGDYLSDANNIALDGVKIPHLFPGTKLNLKPAGNPGGVGSDFESGLLRHTAMGLGLSYEEFSGDYSKSNYSSARASMMNTWRRLQGKKRTAADKIASRMYANVLEEELSAGRLPLPPGKTMAWFYEPLVREALTACSWIGAARGQIDEMKETQAAVMRVQNNLSTLAAECARVGTDWRDVLRQRAREKKMMDELGLTPEMDPARQNPLMDRSGPDRQSDDERNND